MTEQDVTPVVYTDEASARESMAALGDPLDPMPFMWLTQVLADDDPRLFERLLRENEIDNPTFNEDLRTTTEKEADDNAEAQRLRKEAVSHLAEVLDVPSDVIDMDKPISEEDAELYGGAFHVRDMVASGGWRMPHENAYELPEITARRGSISFTRGPDFDAILGKLNKKQLRARLAVVEKALAKERKRRYKLERKVRRFTKIIQRLV